MKTAYFWLTPQGKQLAEQLQAHFGGTVEPKADFAEAVRRAFADCDALVFVMAAGIVVRTIAPLVQSKASDPAVLVGNSQTYVQNGKMITPRGYCVRREESR